ncbi:MAG: hypothetical protein Q8873_08550 [Bacillota bacterium]|nr:hypothetical protein [Bacillota bacterium]
MELPKKFVERMKAMLKEEYPEFERVFSRGDSFSGLRLNPEKVKEIPSFLADAEKVPWCGEGYYIDKSRVSGNHPYHLGGLFYFQEPSAMAVVEALNINEGDFVLDLCAAPGGKATQAGAKLKGTGLLVANEIVAKRAAILAENTERFGLKNTVVTNETPARLAEKIKEFFDKIIVDAPC